MKKYITLKLGKPYSVTTDAANEIAKAMDISIEELLSNINDNQEFVTSPFKMNTGDNMFISIPLVSRIYTGNYLSQDNIIGMKKIEKSLVEIGEFFAYKINDDSMSLFFIKNDIVAVKVQDFVYDGDYSVILVNDKTFVRKVKLLENGIKLIPLNRKINEETRRAFF